MSVSLAQLPRSGPLERIVRAQQPGLTEQRRAGTNADGDVLSRLEVIVTGAPTERVREIAKRQRSAVVACVASALAPIGATCEPAGAPVRAAARVKSFSVQASQEANEAGAGENDERHV